MKILSKICLVLIFALTVTFFVGCTPNDAPYDGDSSDTQSAANNENTPDDGNNKEENSEEIVVDDDDDIKLGEIKGPFLD